MPLDTPWGTATSQEQYLPENLRKARDIANQNRDRLRVINEFQPLNGQQGQAHYSNNQNSNGVKGLLQNPQDVYGADQNNGLGRVSSLAQINDYGRKGSNIPNHAGKKQTDTEYGRKYNVQYPPLKPNLGGQNSQPLREDLGLKEAISRYDRPPKEYDLHNSSLNNNPRLEAEEARLLHERQHRLLEQQAKEQYLNQNSSRKADIDVFDGRQRSIDRVNQKEARNLNTYDAERRRVEQTVRIESAKQKEALRKQQLEMDSIRPMYERPSANPYSQEAQGQNQPQQSARQQIPQQVAPNSDQFGNQDNLQKMDYVQIRDEPYERPQRLSGGFSHSYYKNNNPPHQFDPNQHPSHMVSNSNFDYFSSIF